VLRKFIANLLRCIGHSIILLSLWDLRLSYDFTHLVILRLVCRDKKHTKRL
jgi:hypothetical protein